MNAFQRTRQQQACHVRFKQLVNESVYPDGVAVYQIAGQMFGRSVESLKELADHELNALRDRLQGNDGKQLAAARGAAARAGIKDVNAWIKRLAGSKSFAGWKGQTLETLPQNQVWRLTRMLETRAQKMGNVA